MRLKSEVAGMVALPAAVCVPGNLMDKPLLPLKSDALPLVTLEPTVPASTREHAATC